MCKLQFGISLQASRASWSNERRGMWWKAALCLLKYITSTQTCFQSSELLLFFICMLDFHVSAQAEGTGLVLGSKWLTPKNHTGICKDPKSPTLLQPPPSRELPPWLYQSTPHFWDKDHPLQPTKEKHNMENLRMNVILVKRHHMLPVWQCTQMGLGRLVPEPSR